MYHQELNLVLGISGRIGLWYKGFQKWKTHPHVSKHFEGGTYILYGARVLNEGGYHVIPKVTFPSGALIGCVAGFLNAVKIKGSDTVLKSSMLVVKAAFEQLQEGEPVA